MGREYPSYLNLVDNGELAARAEEAFMALRSCTLCPHECAVNRLKGEKGYCKTGNQAVVASYGAHFGEERPLVGIHGSGTIFFSWCNMRCVYCQNYDISHEGVGNPVTPDMLAFFFFELQEQGCHNINLVTPSHVVPFFLKALSMAASEGLRVPIVYNTSGYDSVDTLKLLDGVVDIYMPDFKYWDPEIGKRLSKVKDYPGVTRKALKEMHRQVGDLVIDDDGIAVRGLLVRHLVLPGGLASTKEVTRFIATKISKNTYINIMDQYRPCGQAHKYPPLDRRITPEEFQLALDEARAAGLWRFDRG